MVLRWIPVNRARRTCEIRRAPRKVESWQEIITYPFWKNLCRRRERQGRPTKTFLERCSGVYRVSRACSRIAPAIRCRETQEASDRPWPSDLHTSHRPRPAQLKAEGGTGTVPVLSS